MSLSLDYFESEKTGRIVARMTSDIDALQELISTGLVMFVQNFLIFVGAVIVILSLSWQLSLGVLVIVPPVVIASRWFRRRSNVAYLEVREAIGENLATLQEGLEGVRVVQAFGQEPGWIRRFGRTNEQQYQANLETVKISAKYFPIVEFTGVMGIAVIVGFGGLLVDNAVVTVGTVLAFVLYLNNLFEPIQQLSQLYNTVQSAGAALHKLFFLLDTDASVHEKPGAVDLPTTGTLAVDGVTFAYGGGPPDTDAIVTRRNCSKRKPTASVMSPSTGRGSLCKNTPPGASIAATLLIASISCVSSKYGRMFVAMIRSKGALESLDVTTSSCSAVSDCATLGRGWSLLNRCPDTGDLGGMNPSAMPAPIW